MRSMLFVPGDSSRKLEKALASGADALIVDLEDSVAPAAKQEARTNAAGYLAAQAIGHGPALWVRINDLAGGLAEADLDAVMAARPAGIVLPKAGGARDVQQLSALLRVHEAENAIPDGATCILAIATETAAATLAIANYQECSTRLTGLSWGAEDLSADIGARTSRDAEGRLTGPFALARNLCLFGAAAAGVAAIDTVFTDLRDSDGLAEECRIAERDGFTGKLAVHPAQVETINACFTPSTEAVAEARAVVSAFEKAGDAGVTSLNGRMLDRPHLVRAKSVLARVDLSRDR